MANLEYQQLFDKALTQQSSEHLSPYVADHVKQLVANTLEIHANLKAEEMALIRDTFPIPVRFSTPKSGLIRPHPVMAALREGVRTCFDKHIQSRKMLKTLFVGATSYDVGKYAYSSQYSFSYHDSEPKDDNRSYEAHAERVTWLVAEARKSFPELDAYNLDFDCTREELVQLYMDCEGIVGRIGFNKERSGEKFNRLVYMDSSYNKSMPEIYEDFRHTGATTALVYAVMPAELLGEHGVDSRLYNITRVGSDLRMTDYRGFANGYQHEENKWRTLLAYPAYQGEEFNLTSEIIMRVGPFYVFEIAKTFNGGPVTRDITLLKEPFVRVVNVFAPMEKPKNLAEWWLRRKVVMSDCFFMRRDEFNMVYDYCASLDEKSCEQTAIVAMIRKRSGGAALIDKVFTKKWSLENEHYMMLACVVLLKVALDRKKAGDARGLFFDEGVLKQTWRAMLTKISVPEWMVDLFSGCAYELEGLVTPYDPVIAQTVYLKAHSEERKKASTFKISVARNNRDALTPDGQSSCEFCSKYPSFSEKDKSNMQVMKCGKKPEIIEYGLNQDQLDLFREKLTSDDKVDGERLARVKDAAKKATPRSAFTHKVKTFILEGAFGTGKSWFIKDTITAEDVVIAPFKKLMKDYKKDKEGNEIFFKTMHRAISDSRACKRMFIDEVGSLPYEYIATCVNSYRPDEVYLIGDMKQTKTLASEGIAVDRRIDFSGAHYLLYNFRNPVETIEWAVEKFGYDMKPAGPAHNSAAQAWTFVEEGTTNYNGIDLTQFPNISPDRALVNIEETEATIRQFQGQTEEGLVIDLTPDNLRTFSAACIKLVGMTRCRGTTYLRLNSDVSKDAVKGILGKVEHVAIAHRKRAEYKQARDARVFAAILKYANDVTERAILEQARFEIKAACKKLAKARKDDELGEEPIENLRIRDDEDDEEVVDETESEEEKAPSPQQDAHGTEAPTAEDEVEDVFAYGTDEGSEYYIDDEADDEEDNMSWEAASGVSAADSDAPPKVSIYDTVDEMIPCSPRVEREVSDETPLIDLRSPTPSTCIETVQAASSEDDEKPDTVDETPESDDDDKPLGPPPLPPKPYIPKVWSKDELFLKAQADYEDSRAYYERTKRDLALWRRQRTSGSGLLCGYNALRQAFDDMGCPYDAEKLLEEIRDVDEYAEFFASTTLVEVAARYSVDLLIISDTDVISAWREDGSPRAAIHITRSHFENYRRPVVVRGGGSALEALREWLRGLARRFSGPKAEKILSFVVRLGWFTMSVLTPPPVYYLLWLLKELAVFVSSMLGLNYMLSNFLSLLRDDLNESDMKLTNDTAKTINDEFFSNESDEAMAEIINELRCGRMLADYHLTYLDKFGLDFTAIFSAVDSETGYSESDARRSTIFATESQLDVTPQPPTITLVSYGQDNIIPVVSVEEDEAFGIVADPIEKIEASTFDLSTLKVKDNRQGWFDKATDYVVDTMHRSVLFEPVAPDVPAPVFRATFDSFRDLAELDPQAAALGEPLNSMVRMPTQNAFTAKITGDMLDYRNARGNLKKAPRRMVLGVGNNLYYSGQDKSQQLCTLATRYAVDRKQSVMDAEGEALALKIPAHFFKAAIDPEKLARVMNDTDMSNVLQGWYKKAKDSGYCSSHCLLAESEDRIVRFQGKGNVKPKEDFLGYEKVFKAPQGISAWSKGANTFFGAACRIISDVYKRSLRDEFVWNNGMSTEEAAKRFSKATLKVPTPMNMRLDAEEMDSKQNAFTHTLNKNLDKMMGFDPDFLDLYYSMYAEYLLIADDASVQLFNVKPSGAPWTLKGNSFLMAMLTYWLIDGEGPIAFFFQGDDVDRNQANMRFNEDKLANLALYTSFVMTMECGESAAFCGYILDSNVLVPNIRRKVNKVIGAGFRSTLHFCEFQVGLRDYCKKLRSDMAFADILQSNANMYNVSVAEAERWFEALESLSHISPRQMAEVVRSVTEIYPYMQMDFSGNPTLLSSVH